MIGGVPVYVVAPPLGGASTHALLMAALAGPLRREAPGVVLAPAGVAAVEDEDAAHARAEALRAAARQAGMALVFGLDVGPPAPGSVHLFASLGGAPVMWPLVAGRGCPRDLGRRMLYLGGQRAFVLSAAEALDPVMPRRMALLGGAEAIFVLSHGGATQRWAPRLRRLETVAPLVVAAHHGGAGRGYATPSLAVRWLPLGERDVARAA